jgi:hypothetical protein
MDCELKERERYIAEYVNGTLPEEDMARFEEHYFQCSQCFMDVTTVVDAASLIAADGKRLTASQRKKTFLNISMPSAGSRVKWGIAFASAALIILMILLSDNNFKTEDSYTSENETYSDPEITEKEPEPGDDFATMTGPSFEPSQYMEEWITETHRSSADDVKVISPAAGKIFSDEDVQFSWQTRAESGVNLIILNNQEEEVFSAQLNTGNKQSILADKKIFREAGLYYWRIENEEEVIYINKFYYLKTE